MKLRRIDHVGVVVADLRAHVAQLEAMGLVLERVGDNIESHALYYPCGDASVELIEVRDPLIGAERLGEGEQARWTTCTRCVTCWSRAALRFRGRRSPRARRR